MFCPLLTGVWFVFVLLCFFGLIVFYCVCHETFPGPGSAGIGAGEKPRSDKVEDEVIDKVRALLKRPAGKDADAPERGVCMESRLSSISLKKFLVTSIQVRSWAHWSSARISRIPGRGIKIKIKLFGFFGGLLCFALY